MDNILEIVKQMTMEEKARILTGKDFWNTVPFEKYGIPQIFVSDGPNGLRKQGEDSDNLGINGSEKAVCYPPAAIVACSFDKDLAYEFGKNLGIEGRYQGINVLLAPAINIQRSPLGGRNFEYFSEDPLITGVMASEYIKGIQSQNLGTCLKHYAVNSQEKMRLVSNSVVDDRALFEIYLKAFRFIVKEAKPTSIMTSYNQVNGEYIAESKFFLQEFMREKNHFDGAFISDWGAVHNIVESVKNGLNLEMPGGEIKSDKVILEAIKKGQLSTEDVDNRVCELLKFIFKVNTKQMGENNVYTHLKFAQKSLEESAVLLKNDDILPFKENEKVLYVGELCYNPRYQGSGSSKVNIVEKDSIIEVLKNKEIDYDFVQGFEQDIDNNRDELLQEAVEKAKRFDKVVICVGYPEYIESEAYDKTTMELPSYQNKLIEEISKVNDNIVVILNCGSPVAMEWKDNVKGIIYENFCGSYGGKAMVNILYGKVNPSGKLAQTFPVKVEDTPCYETFSKNDRNVLYKESVFVGYRYYQTAKKEVLFPFGHGLSYTDFEMKLIENDNDKIKISLKNIGKVAGKQVVQVYKQKKDSNIFRPDIEIVWFDKVYLEPQEEKELTININREMFEFYNSEIKDYDVEDGEYTLLIGDSSVNLPIQVKTNIKGSVINKVPSKYFEVVNNDFSLEEFEKIYNKKIEPYKFKKPYNINSTVSELRKSFIGKIMAGVIKNNKNTQNEMAKNALDDLPLRMVLMADFNRDFLDGMVEIANGHIIKGIKKMKTKD